MRGLPLLITLALVAALSLLSFPSFASAARSPVVARWSVLDVMQWLGDIGLAEYAAAVEEEHIDGESLLDLTPDEWAAHVGVKKLGHRKKIAKELGKLSGGVNGEAEADERAAATTPVATKQPAKQPSKPAATSAPAASASPKKQAPAASSTTASSKTVKRKSGIVDCLSAEAGAALFDSRTVSLPPERRLTAAQEKEVAEFVRQGVALHQRDRFEDARAMYQRALGLNPRHARTLHMLGLIAMQYEQNDDRAGTLLRQSLSISPDADAATNLGNFLWHSQKACDAITAWQRALETNPLAGGPALRARFAEVLYTEALRIHALGEVDLTARYLTRSWHLANEALLMHFPPAYVPHMSARMIRAQFGDGDEGEDGVASSSEADSSDSKLVSFLSSTPRNLLGTNSVLTHSLRTILADSLLHLGLLAEAGGDLDSAARALALQSRAALVAPDHTDSTYPKNQQLATIVSEARGYKTRLEAQVGAQGPRTRSEFALALKGRTDELLRGQVSGAGPLATPGERNRQKKVVEFLHKNCKTAEATELALLLQDDLTFHSPRYPHLYGSNGEITQTRREFEDRLDELLSDPLTVNQWADGIGLEWCRFRFYLAYHGVGNRRILEKLAAVYLRMTPVLTYTAPHLLRDPLNGIVARRAGRAVGRAAVGEKRIKVAFLSAFLSHHPVGNTVAGYVYHLPRERFQVAAFFVTLQGSLEGAGDHVYERIKKSADHFRTIAPEDWAGARAAVEDFAPDILLYGDIGMEPTSYFLSFGRLAPIQAMTFGHPDSSGVPNMDYFISHRGMDQPADDVAQSFYSEKLVRLPGVGFWHRAVVPAQRFSRDFYGLSDEQLLDAGVEFPSSSSSEAVVSSGDSKYTLYLVTKSTQFFSPDFMDALAGVLFAHPRAFLALLMETGKNTKGYDVHNACIDHVYDGIETRLRLLRAKAGLTELDEEEEESAAEEEAERRAARHPVLGDTPYASDVLGKLASRSSTPRPRPAISGRLRFVDRGDHDYFVNLLRVADVLLQPLPLDGTTTTLEAVTVGLPTVLHRSPMVGGRMASAIYQHIGLEETSADNVAEYIDIAVRLGTDPVFAQSVRDKLKAATDNTGEGRLFEDPAAIDAYADWMETAVAENIASGGKK